MIVAENTDLHAKITKIKGKIPRITCLATNLVLTAVGNKYLMLVV